MTEHTPTPGLRTNTTDEVAERYCDELLLALRMKDVPGNRIGEVLAEVRDHLTSSGEDPAEAFGTPQDYAGALTAGRSGARWSAPASATAGNAAGVAGLLWTVTGATALLTRQPAVLTEFQIVLPVAVAVAAPLLIDAVVSARRATALGWGLLVTIALPAVAVLHAWVGPLISVAVPAVVLLVPGSLVAVAWIIATARTVDPVVDPLQDAVSIEHRRRRDGLLFTTLLLLLLVVPVVVSVGLQHLS
ncbi:hypothetical protein FHR75_003856 [Kineococcus radiotolerans]|uniref:Uncharacterized protein n=1 Tax=Kineococcus radiotolerans TaxID=131568 RepID=A0A7W4TQ22_KINRA|nr:hypothetical protein [Kineococcus radiotolerans]MBB2903020.1 hypothetical protein [Kineococcus radiotolerans]